MPTSADRQAERELLQWNFIFLKKTDTDPMGIAQEQQHPFLCLQLLC